MSVSTFQNRTAFYYMFAGVLAWSFAPLAIDLANGSESPLFFNVLWKFGSLIGAVVFLLARYRHMLTDRVVLSTLWRRSRSWVLVWIALGHLDIALFAWSIQYVDVTIATVLFQSWPIFTTASTLILFRGSGRFAGTTAAVILPLTVAFVGVWFLTEAAQSGEQNLVAGYQVLGAVLAIAASLCSGVLVVSFTVKWGVDFRESLGSRSSDDAELLGAVFIREASFIPIAILTVILSIAMPNLVFSDQVPALRDIDPEFVLIGLLGGAFIAGTSNIMYRKANLTTSNLGVNAVIYAGPIIAVAWILLFSNIWPTVRPSDIHPDFFVIGTLAVISANLLINFQAEIRFGFRSLIIALWASGAFVYFRDDLAEHLALEGWLWPPGEYFTAVGLAATVFTLILSFRVARLVTRTSDETNRAFALFSRIDLLASRGVIPDAVRGYILRIDAHENATDLADAYRSARSSIRGAYQATTADADQRELADAAAAVDALAHSRQEGQDFGEYVALVVFAVITVALILLSLDAGVTGWNGFLTEMFTILFSAVIIFLVVNVWDLQRERSAPVLRPEADNEGYSVVFRDTVGRRFEQVVSIVVVLAMTAAYGWLFWGKWLG